MSDNTTLNPGTGGDVIAADDVAGVKYQVVKLAVGADGAASLVANANPIPVSDAGGSITVDNAGTFSVQVDAALPAGTNAIGKLAANSGVDIGDVDITSIAAGDNNIGNVDIVTVPSDPFGANADAASATGSISAKLRFIASTGIPITGTVTVGSHAVTNAGTFVVQENGAALTALQLIDNLVLAEDSAHVSGDPGVQIFAVRNDAGTALAGTTGDYIPLSTDANGALRVVGSSGTTQYTEDGASAGGESLCLMGAVRRDTAASSSGTDGDYSTLNTDANGNLRVAVSAGGVSGIVDDAAFTPGTSEVLPIGFQADESSTDSVNEGDAGCPRMTLDRKVIVTQQPHTQGGLNTSAGSITTTVTSVKASAGQLYGYYIYNPNASVAYCQIFDLATGSVTLGTTTPKLSFGIPATSAANVTFPNGIAFATAISIAFTTTRAGSTAPGSSVDYNFYHF